MFLMERQAGHMLAVEDLESLFNPYKTQLECRSQHGEEEQDLEIYEKNDLIFLSHEELPRCWVDPHYRDKEVSQRQNDIKDSNIGFWSMP